MHCRLLCNCGILLAGDEGKDAGGDRKAFRGVWRDATASAEPLEAVMTFANWPAPQPLFLPLPVLSQPTNQTSSRPEAASFAAAVERTPAFRRCRCSYPCLSSPSLRDDPRSPKLHSAPATPITTQPTPPTKHNQLLTLP